MHISMHGKKCPLQRQQQIPTKGITWETSSQAQKQKNKNKMFAASWHSQTIHTMRIYIHSLKRCQYFRHAKFKFIQKI